MKRRRRPRNSLRLEKKSEKDKVALLTGTMRGCERDQLTGNPVFRAFQQEGMADGPLYLVATSAGEVGVNISGERLVTMLTESDRLLQRLGRLNRFGDQDGEPHRIGEAHVIYIPPKKADEATTAQGSTLDYLRTLRQLEDGSYDVSCRALREGVQPPFESRSPQGAIARLDERLIDLWSQTAASGAAIPPVESWLHGQQKDLPETEVAWRAEVQYLVREGVSEADRKKALKRYRVLPIERLKEPTKCALDKLGELATRHGDQRVLLQAADGSIHAFPLSELSKYERKIEYGMVLLPPGCGSLERGMFRDEADDEHSSNDVADKGPKRRRFLAKRYNGDWTWEGIGRSEVDPVPDDKTPLALARYARQEGLGAPIPILIAKLSDDPDSADEYLVFFPSELGRDGLTEVDLLVHCKAVAERAETMATSAGFGDWAGVFKNAGIHHDLGKKHPLWQRAMGGNVDSPKAKTQGPANPALLATLAGFRHELASLVQSSLEVDDDLFLHLIASHHGWARPFWESKAYDRTGLRASEDAAVEAARRFGRLQEKWGPWGLAYLESLFKAADWLASRGDDE